MRSDRVVVDASLAIKWVIEEPDSTSAVALLNNWTDAGTKVIAPALLSYEVTNTLHRQVMKGKISHEEAREALTDILSMGILLTFSQYRSVSAAAIKFAHEFNLSATYDAHYLGLAHRENCEYWTADTRLWNSVKGRLDWVRNFSDYQPA